MWSPSFRTRSITLNNYIKSLSELLASGVSHLNCGKSIRGDDVFGTFFDVLPLPRVLIVGDRTVRMQSHVVSQVLTIAHLNKGTGKDN